MVLQNFWKPPYYLGGYYISKHSYRGGMVSGASYTTGLYTVIPYICGSYIVAHEGGVEAAPALGPWQTV